MEKRKVALRGLEFLCAAAIGVIASQQDWTYLWLRGSNCILRPSEGGIHIIKMSDDGLRRGSVIENGAVLSAD